MERERVYCEFFFFGVVHLWICVRFPCAVGCYYVRNVDKGVVRAQWVIALLIPLDILFHMGSNDRCSDDA